MCRPLIFGTAPASVDNGIYAPQVTQVNLGERYKFTVFGSSSLRVQIQNVLAAREWTTQYTPGFSNGRHRPDGLCLHHDQTCSEVPSALSLDRELDLQRPDAPCPTNNLTLRRGELITV